MKSKRWLLLFWAIVFSFLLLLSLLAKEVYWSPLTLNNTLKIVVEEGEGINKVAERLFHQRVIRFPRLLSWTYRFYYPAQPLVKGSYLLHVNEPLITLVKTLGERKRLRGKFTIVEGWTWRQLFSALGDEARIRHHTEAELKKHYCAQHYASMQQPYPYACLEGIFLSGTYYFYEGSSDKDVLNAALDAQRKALARAWESRSKGALYQTPEQGLIVASLIQKETSNTQEYHKIASVIHTRLLKNMRLQIDASVLYGLRREKGLVSLKDLKKPTPYNVYLNYGLPPTPIAYVEERTLTAALQPDLDNRYLFYVANGKGSHYFTSDYTQHIRMKHFYKSRNKKKVAAR